MCAIAAHVHRDGSSCVDAYADRLAGISAAVKMDASTIVLLSTLTVRCGQGLPARDIVPAFYVHLRVSDKRRTDRAMRFP